MKDEVVKMAPLPEFLCLKYKGVRRIDQITSQAESFGWKCRKYQNWKQVHADTEDKLLLKSIGDSLIEKGRFDPASFGRLSSIFFNVQRWRADREQMAIDPEVLGPWTEVDTLLHVIREQPSVLPQKLRRDFADSKSLSEDLAPIFFFGAVLLKMLRDEGLPFATQIDLQSSMPTKQWNEVITDLLTSLYSAVGLKAATSKSQGFQMLAQAFGDLGFTEPSFAAGSYTWDASEAAIRAVTIRYTELSPSVLMKVESREGATVVTLNPQHPFILDTSQDQIAKRAVERLLSACAEAMQQMPSCGDDFNLFTSLIGMILRRK